MAGRFLLKMRHRSVILSVSVILLLITCVDPYNPGLDNYQSLLVVDAVVTGNDVPAYVRLSVSSLTPDEEPPPVSGAQVSISDNLGNLISLSEASEGFYFSDIKTPAGVPGRIYTLRIQTSEGKVYESEPCLLEQAGEIDTVYYEKESHITDDGEDLGGIMIYLDSKGPADSKYFRWSYEEWWKFNVPYPVTHQYIDEYHIPEIPVENVTCYKHRESEEVIIQSGETGIDPVFIKKPLCFIASEKSDRLMMQYCIQVNQYSISEKEYEFWRQMKDISESGGDIFDRQPYQIMTNVHCISDPDEMVLGYFHVCSVNKKRIWIRGSDIEKMELIPYQYVCDVIIKGPDDYLADKPVTFDRIYKNFTALNYNFISPKGDRLMFADKNCSDCTMSGNPEKPDFWVDLE